MNTYTFSSSYGDYSFSDKQIESNPHLTSREKEIMHGLALGQTVAKRNNTSSKLSARNYDYEVTNKNGRKELTRTPNTFSFELDWSEKRWYESDGQFMQRKAKEVRKNSRTTSKEVKRENFKIEKSTFADGTEITDWDKETKLFW